MAKKLQVLGPLTGIHIGPDEPTSPNVCLWIDTDEEAPPGITDEHINSLINAALSNIPNAAEVAY